MAKRKSTKLKTSADYKAEIERTKQKLADLEKTCCCWRNW